MVMFRNISGLELAQFVFAVYQCASLCSANHFHGSHTLVGRGTLIMTGVISEILKRAPERYQNYFYGRGLNNVSPLRGTKSVDRH